MQNVFLSGSSVLHVGNPRIGNDYIRRNRYSFLLSSPFISLLLHIIVLISKRKVCVDFQHNIISFMAVLFFFTVLWAYTDIMHDCDWPVYVMISSLRVIDTK